MGWVAEMNAYNYRCQSRSGLTFGCRYVQRTLSQLGEDALHLPLVTRHLSDCPACRAHRRRITRVDRAFKDELQWETPPFFSGRWDSISSRLDINGSQKRTGKTGTTDLRSSWLIGALVSLALLVGFAWSVDRDNPATDSAVVVAPGVSVTEASVAGEKATVSVVHEDEEDGTLFLWIGHDDEDPSLKEDHQ